MSMQGRDNRVKLVRGESRTKQSFKDSCDINRIMSDFRRTGLVTHLSSRHPVYADVSAMTDFRQAMDHVKEVESFFMELPAEVRRYFDNDTVAFLEWMNDPGRTKDELRELGLKLMDDDPSNDPPAISPVEPPPVDPGEAGAQ